LSCRKPAPKFAETLGVGQQSRQEHEMNVDTAAQLGDGDMARCVPQALEDLACALRSKDEKPTLDPSHA
jgi:hypothetical protein